MYETKNININVAKKLLNEIIVISAGHNKGYPCDSH